MSALHGNIISLFGTEEFCKYTGLGVDVKNNM